MVELNAAHAYLRSHYGADIIVLDNANVRRILHQRWCFVWSQPTAL